MGFKKVFEQVANNMPHGTTYEQFIELTWNCDNLSTIAPNEKGERWPAVDADAVTACIRQVDPNYHFDPQSPDNETVENQKDAFEQVSRFEYEQRVSPARQLSSDRQCQLLLAFADHFKNEIPGMKELLDQALTKRQADPRTDVSYEYLMIRDKAMDYFLEKAPEVQTQLDQLKTPADFREHFNALIWYTRLGGSVEKIMEGSPMDERYEKLRVASQAMMTNGMRMEQYMSFLASPLSPVVNHKQLAEMPLDKIRRLREPLQALVKDGNLGITDEFCDFMDGRRALMNNDLTQALGTYTSDDLVFCKQDGTMLPSESDFQEELLSGHPAYAMNKKKPDIKPVLAQLVDKQTVEVAIGSNIEQRQPERPQPPRSPGLWERLKDWYYRTTNQEGKRTEACRAYHRGMEEYKSKLQDYKNLQQTKTQYGTLASEEKLTEVAEHMVQETFGKDLKTCSDEAKAKQLNEKKAVKQKKEAFLSFNKHYLTVEEKIDQLPKQVDPDTVSKLRRLNAFVRHSRTLDVDPALKGKLSRNDVIHAAMYTLVGEMVDKNISDLASGKTKGLSKELDTIASIKPGKSVSSTYTSLMVDNFNSAIIFTARKDDKLCSFIDQAIKSKPEAVAGLMTGSRARVIGMLGEMCQHMTMTGTVSKTPAYNDLYLGMTNTAKNMTPPEEPSAAVNSL